MVKSKDDLVFSDDSPITPDFEQSVRVPSRVTTNSFSGITILEPMLDVSASTDTVNRLLIEEPKRVQDGSHNLTQHHQGRFREDPIEFGKQLTAWANGSGWRAYTEYLGAKIMYEGFTDSCIKSILDSKQVNEKIKELSQARLPLLHLPAECSKADKLAELERQLRQVTLKISKGLVARMDSPLFLRFFGASVNMVLVRLYNQGIHISLSEYAAFREVAELAAEKKQSLLIVPNHRSHIDYLSISWLFYRLGISLPFIVAGENLNMPILGPALQACGAFFIRRKFTDDELYPVVVKEYVESLLAGGFNIECFIEGGRSRTGKLLSPKLGILKRVVEAIENGRTDDVWIAPISLQYDKVIETEAYANELLGNPKEQETLSGLLGSIPTIGNLKLGRVDLRFQKPFSLKSWLGEQNERRRNEKPGVATNRAKEQNKVLKALGYQILSDINKVSVIMPAALVGSVILTIRGRGVGRSELINKVGWLREAIVARGGRVAEFAGMDMASVVDRALLVLKDLIGEHKNLLEPTFYPINRFELSFYRNQIVHLFVAECLLSASLYTKVKAGGIAPSQRMTRQDLTSEISFLSVLLKNEFIYGVEGLEKNVHNTLESMEKDGVIAIEGEWVGLSTQERAKGRENFDFFCFLAWPFVESYWLAAVSLFALTPLAKPRADSHVAWVEEKAFQKSAQQLGKNLFATGDVSYFEAVNQATLSNSFQRMVEHGVILTKRSSAGVPLIALHPEWLPHRRSDAKIVEEGRLWTFLGRLGAFRREGKNRRDTATVSTRVFSLLESLQPQFVDSESSIFEGVSSPSSDFWAEKPKL